MANELFSVQFTTNTLDTPKLDYANARDQLRELEKFCSASASQVLRTTTVAVLDNAVQSTGTITLASVAAGHVVEVNGVQFTGVSGTAVVANAEFKRGVSDNADAVSLAAAINGSTDARISGVVTAAGHATLGIVTVTAVNGGYAGNAITLKNIGIAASDAVTLSGVDVDDTLSVNGAALTAKQQRATGTLTAATAVAGTTFVLNGVTFVGVEGAATAGQNTFSVDTGDTACAASIVTQINACTSPLVSGVVTATSATDTVTIRAVTAGVAGNAITLVGTATVLEASDTTLLAGIAVANDQFDVSPGSTNTQVAADLVRCINASTTSLITNHVRATSAAAVVTVYSKYGGLVANQITCAGSDGDISAATARLAGATVASHEGVQASATVTIAAGGSGTYTVTIGGVAAASAIAWNTDAGTTATDIVAAIAASTSAVVRGVVTATNSAGVITVTAVRGGLSGNQITLAASGSVVTPSVSSARLASGAVPTTVVLSGTNLASGTNTARNSLTL
jgi:hypothetical protein